MTSAPLRLPSEAVKVVEQVRLSDLYGPERWPTTPPPVPSDPTVIAGLMHLLSRSARGALHHFSPHSVSQGRRVILDPIMVDVWPSPSASVAWTEADAFDADDVTIGEHLVRERESRMAEVHFLASEVLPKLDTGSRTAVLSGWEVAFAHEVDVPVTGTVDEARDHLANVSHLLPLRLLPLTARAGLDWREAVSEASRPGVETRLSGFVALRL